MSQAQLYDLIIIGAGPAGLSAAIYAARRKLKTLILAKDVGGQVALTSEIENYPGFDHIVGMQLVENMKQQAEKWGAEINLQEVTQLEPQATSFKIKTVKQDYHAKSVILAFGLKPRQLGIAGEQEFRGRGVTYCATCDGPLYKDKVVGVVGGGNSALEAVEYLSKIAKQVYLIHRSDEFRAAHYLLTRAKKMKNVEFYCHSQVKQIQGEQVVQSVVLENSQTKQTEDLKLDGLFIEIGWEAKTEWLKDILDLNDRQEIKVDVNNRTSVKGVLAAGDCTGVDYKQIVIAAGEGAKAALEAYRYLVAEAGLAEVSDHGQCKLVGTDKVVKMKLEK